MRQSALGRRVLLPNNAVSGARACDSPRHISHLRVITRDMVRLTSVSNSYTTYFQRLEEATAWNQTCLTIR